MGMGVGGGGLPGLFMGFFMTMVVTNTLKMVTDILNAQWTM